MNDNQERDREMLEAELVQIDRRRAELEAVCQSLPQNAHCCADNQRDELDDGRPGERGLCGYE